MIYIAIDAEGKATGFATDLGLFEAGTDYITRHDIKSLAQAEEIAAQLLSETSKLFLAVDHGTGRSSRFDVTPAPVIGDLVSAGFNGDYYPCGHITKVSKTFRKVTTSTGAEFFRCRQTARWMKGSWAMVRGHHTDKNPSF